ncbi:MAG: hypothetical protein R3A13_12160 [Bdellovibrionota bacterium]
MFARNNQRGVVLIFFTLSIVVLILLGSFGAVASFMLLQKSMIVRSLDHTAEGIGGELLKQLEALKQANGGTIPPGISINPFVPPSILKGNEILAANYEKSKYFADETAPVLTENEVTTGVWNFAGAPACEPNCFTASSDASQVNAVFATISSDVSGRSMFGAGFLDGMTDITLNRFVIVYFDSNIGGAAVVDRN